MSKARGSAAASNLWSIVATAALTAGLVFILSGASGDAAYLQATFTPEHTQMISMYDSRGQQWAHRAVVLALGLLGFGLWVLRPLGRLPAAPAWLATATLDLRARSALLLFLSVAAALAVNYKHQPATNAFFGEGRVYALFLLTSPTTQVALMAAGVCAVMLAVAVYRRWPLAATGLAQLAPLAVLVYALAFALLGGATRPDFFGFPPERLALVEWHYSGSVGSADRLASGESFEQVLIHSGLLSSVLLAIWQRLLGTLDFGGHIRFIASLQILFLAAAVVAYFLWYRARPVAFSFALLLVLPWIQPLHSAVLYPSQSAWRYLGLALAALTIVCTHRSGISAAGRQGAMAMVCLLWNVETGVCALFALAGLLVLQARSGKDLVARAAPRFVLGGLVTFVAFLVLVRAGLGQWLNPVTLAKSFPLLGAFAQGYGGLRLNQVDPVAALIFVHALFVVVRGMLLWGRGAHITPRHAARVCIAGLIVLWAAYYFKGPNLWNLWSFLFLYGFLLGDLLAPALLGVARRQTPLRALGRAPLLAFALVIFPALVASNLAALQTLMRAGYLAALLPGCAGGEILSGACMPREMASALRSKADEARQVAAQGVVALLTSNSYLMPQLSGVHQPLRQRDVFSETIRQADFPRLIEDLVALRPACVLFDAPASLYQGYPTHRAFYARVRVALEPFYTTMPPLTGWLPLCAGRAP